MSTESYEWYMVQLLKINILDVEQQVLYLLDLLVAAEFDEEVTEVKLLEGEEFFDVLLHPAAVKGE